MGEQPTNVNKNISYVNTVSSQYMILYMKSLCNRGNITKN